VSWSVVGESVAKVATYFRLQKLQVPQHVMQRMTTRSPFLKFLTSAPVSSMTPAKVSDVEDKSQFDLTYQCLHGQEFDLW
jgi:hypothetical protein